MIIGSNSSRKEPSKIQFSTDKPDRAPLAMNVSRTADAAFLKELQRHDRQRYDRLRVAIERNAYRAQRQKNEEQTLPLAA